MVGGSSSLCIGEVESLRKELPALLAELERVGLVDRWWKIGPEESDPLQRKLWNLGIVYLDSTATKVDDQPGVIIVQPPFAAGSVTPEDVTEAVEAVFTRPDNLEKLEARTQDQSGHLFIWLYDDPGAAALMLPYLQPQLATSWPRSAPRLPSAVTTVWAAEAPAVYGLPAQALWRSSGNTWEVLSRQNGWNLGGARASTWLRIGRTGGKRGFFASALVYL